MGEALKRLGGCGVTSRCAHSKPATTADIAVAQLPWSAPFCVLVCPQFAHRFGGVGRSGRLEGRNAGESLGVRLRTAGSEIGRCSLVHHIASINSINSINCMLRSAYDLVRVGMMMRYIKDIIYTVRSVDRVWGRFSLGGAFRAGAAPISATIAGPVSCACCSNGLPAFAPL